MRLQSEQNGQPLPLTNGPSKIVKDRRFELDYDADSGSYKLTIDNVVKEDEGKYQCQVVSDVSHIITSGNAFNFCAEYQLLGSFSKQTRFKVLLS